MIDDRTAFAALYSQPYGTPVHMTTNLTALGLNHYENYDFFELFSGEYLGTYHYSAQYNFTINPSGDVHAFYAEPAASSKKKL